ncbi:MAG: NifU family protein [Erysipelothrix sp.]|nr:NifU family protein [Erysipelothrix sp.]
MEKINEIKQTIEKIRPYINRDGGDVEFVGFDEDNGVVTVKMLGACVGCAAVDQTVFYGIQSLLMEEVAGVNEVKLDTSNW